MVLAVKLNNESYIQKVVQLNPDIFPFENIVDPNQLASLKPADQDLEGFLFIL